MLPRRCFFGTVAAGSVMLAVACSGPLDQARFERDLAQARRCFLNVTPHQKVPPEFEFAASIEPEATGEWVVAPFVHDGRTKRYRLNPPQPLIPGQATTLRVRIEDGSDDAPSEGDRWSLLVLVYPRHEAAKLPSTTAEFEGHCPPGFLYASKLTPLEVASAEVRE